MRSTRRFFTHRLAALAALAVAASSARAVVGGLPTNVGHADSSPEWEKLRAQLFGTRPIEAAQQRVQLTVPLRAAYGASVPVKIVSKIAQTPELFVRRMWVLVDKNPSPLAAMFDLTTEVGQADFETRLRVDEYSHVRAIGEMNDGSLHMASRYVKVSGGCSAPPNRDQMHLIGKTSLRIPEGLKRGEPTAADVTVIHPNDTGFELNNVTVMFIPPHFVRRVKVTYGEQLLFDADQDFSISENPMWRFRFVPRGVGVLVAEVEDSKEQRFQGRLDLAAVA